MNMSFYSAAVGSWAHQSKLDTVANNLANLNTVGYKTQDASFADLLYTNINVPAAEQNVNLKSGSGTRYEKTDVLFAQGGPQSTGEPLDYAIQGRGFFAVRNPATQEVRYTRDGSFKLSLRDDEEFYLATSSGDLVLSEDSEPIAMSEDQLTIEEPEKVGVFDFDNTEGMLCVGNNQFVPIAKNGAPQIVEEPDVKTQYLEMSNANMADEMAKVIETQRAFQLSLRMIQTSDEIEQTINSLR